MAKKYTAAERLRWIGDKFDRDRAVYAELNRVMQQIKHSKESSLEHGELCDLLALGFEQGVLQLKDPLEAMRKREERLARREEAVRKIANSGGDYRAIIDAWNDGAGKSVLPTTSATNLRTCQAINALLEAGEQPEQIIMVIRWFFDAKPHWWFNDGLRHAKFSTVLRGKNYRTFKAAQERELVSKWGDRDVHQNRHFI
ncbi:hypothetical protein GRP89_08500 [Citrobacter freundii]|nr:hypothetical protein GRP89_08500 [Citrobacter freundii]